MTDSSSLHRNRMFSQATERIITQVVRWGAIAVKTLVQFIQEMVRTAVGK